LNNDLLESFKSRLSNLDWKKSIVLLISIFLSVYSYFICNQGVLGIPFTIGTFVCLVLFYLEIKFWTILLSLLLLLKITYILPQFFITLEFGTSNFKINVLALILLIVHLNLNNSLTNKLLQKLRKSEKTKNDNFQSRVQRFEFKYRYKSIKQLNEIIEDKGVMTKEAVQAAVNLIDKFDMG